MNLILHFTGKPDCLPFAITVTHVPETNPELAQEFARRVIMAGAVHPDIYGSIPWPEVVRCATVAEILMPDFELMQR